MRRARRGSVGFAGKTCLITGAAGNLGRAVAGALADVVLFLASERARAIHGAAIPVSGLV